METSFLILGTLVVLSIGVLTFLENFSDFNKK